MADPEELEVFESLFHTKTFDDFSSEKMSNSDVWDVSTRFPFSKHETRWNKKMCDLSHASFQTALWSPCWKYLEMEECPFTKRSSSNGTSWIKWPKCHSASEQTAGSSLNSSFLNCVQTGSLGRCLKQRTPSFFLRKNPTVFGRFHKDFSKKLGFQTPMLTF